MRGHVCCRLLCHELPVGMTRIKITLYMHNSKQPNERIRTLSYHSQNLIILRYYVVEEEPCIVLYWHSWSRNSEEIDNDDRSRLEMPELGSIQMNCLRTNAFEGNDQKYCNSISSNYGTRNSI